MTTITVARVTSVIGGPRIGSATRATDEKESSEQGGGGRLIGPGGLDALSLRRLIAFETR